MSLHALTDSKDNANIQKWGYTMQECYSNPWNCDQQGNNQPRGPYAQQALDYYHGQQTNKETGTEETGTNETNHPTKVVLVATPTLDGRCTPLRTNFSSRNKETTSLQLYSRNHRHHLQEHGEMVTQPTISNDNVSMNSGTDMSGPMAPVVLTSMIGSLYQPHVKYATHPTIPHAKT